MSIETIAAKIGENLGKLAAEIILIIIIIKSLMKWRKKKKNSK